MNYVCTLKEDVASHILKGYIPIKTMRELYITVAKSDTRELLIEDDFVEAFFTKTGLNDFIKETNRMNKYIKISCRREPILQKEKLKKILDTKDINDMICKLIDDKSLYNIIKDLCKDKEISNTESLIANNKLASMYLDVIEARNISSTEIKKRELLQEQLNTTRSGLDTLVSRINYNYNKDIKIEDYSGIEQHISNYSKILYIKEIVRVHYVDTLIYYLQEILKTINSISVRVVVIESAYAYKRSRLYPRLKSATNISYSDVYSGDIFMAGFNPKLVRDILMNPTKAEYLIVLDRSGFDSNYINGDGIEYVYTVSDIEDLERYGVYADNIISYSKETMYIPFIQDFNELSMEGKINKYSSMGITQKLIELLERSVH